MRNFVKIIHILKKNIGPWIKPCATPPGFHFPSFSNTFFSDGCRGLQYQTFNMQIWSNKTINFSINLMRACFVE